MLATKSEMRTTRMKGATSYTSDQKGSWWRCNKLTHACCKNTQNVPTRQQMNLEGGNELGLILNTCLDKKHCLICFVFDYFHKQGFLQTVHKSYRMVCFVFSVFF